MEILRVEKLTNERWLNLFAADFTHNDHAGRWIFASRKPKPQQAELRADAVILVPILHVPGQSPRLVMVKEFRVPVGGWVYGFPAGLVEPGESIEETVHRELREETGFAVTHIKRLSPPLFSSCGMTDEATVLVFLDAQAPPDARPCYGHGEEIEVLLLDYAEACLLCDDPNIRIDAKAWSALYLYQQLGRFI